MHIQDIYDKYTVPPRLQEHMYLVAGVGTYMANYSVLPIEKDHITVACLLHDIGNIIKFDLENGLIPLTLDEKTYRKNVQQTYIQTYGANEHIAHHRICAEITDDPRITQLIDQMGTRHLLAHIQRDPIDLTQCIVAYADMRVTPEGITSLDQRLDDAFVRYAHLHPNTETYRIYRTEKKRLRKQFEKILFTHLTITPEDVTSAHILPLIDMLKNKEIPRKHL